MTFSALVVGLGQIGMGYDLNSSEHILTHTRAFERHPDFILCGGVDPSPERRNLFSKNYSAPVFSDIASAMEKLHPDVVAISVPTSEHYQALCEILDNGSPTAILCEKPLAYDLGEAHEIVERSAQKNCKLFVNYFRRADCGTIEIKKRLDNNQIKSPVKGVAWYSKGLFNNGSHFLDLLQYWLGEIRSFEIVAIGRKWNKNDPEPDLKLSFMLGDILFLAANEENFSHYTLELIATNGRLRVEQVGEKLSWQGTEGDTTFAGYTILQSIPETIKTDFLHVQYHVAEQISLALQGRSTQITSGTEALKTLDILSKIRAKL